MFKCAQFGVLSMVLLSSVGCARWTLWPKNDLPLDVPQNGRSAVAQASWDEPIQSSVNPNAHRARDIMATQAQAGGVAKLDLKNLEPSLAIARLSERQGDPDQARILYLRYIQKNPRHPLPHHRLGVMAAREAKYEEALQHFDRATELAPPSVELLSDLGYLYYLLDRLDEAEQTLRQAGRAEPANSMVQNNLALVIAAKGNFNESMRVFRRVNDEAEARANQAYVLSQHGELEHARQEYLKALTIDNSLTNAAKALLQVDEAHKQSERAVAQAEAQAAAQQDPLLRMQGQREQGPGSGARFTETASHEHLPAQQLHSQPIQSERIAHGTAAPSPQFPGRQQMQTQPHHPGAGQRQDMSAMLMPLPAAAAMPGPVARPIPMPVAKQTPVATPPSMQSPAVASRETSPTSSIQAREPVRLSLGDSSAQDLVNKPTPWGGSDTASNPNKSYEYPVTPVSYDRPVAPPDGLNGQRPANRWANGEGANDVMAAGPAPGVTPVQMVFGDWNPEQSSSSQVPAFNSPYPRQQANSAAQWSIKDSEVGPQQASWTNPPAHLQPVPSRATDTVKENKPQRGNGVAISLSDDAPVSRPAKASLSDSHR